MNDKISKKERLILLSTLKGMIESKYEEVDRRKIALSIGITFEVMVSLFPSDDVLRMKAIKYAAFEWCQLVEEDINKELDSENKIKKLIRHYIAGTESHSGSLSLYVDVWKRIRDRNEEEHLYIRQELAEIYLIYVVFFKKKIYEICNYEIAAEEKISSLAWILVVISDGFHIQKMVQQTEIDFDALTDLFKDISKVYMKDEEYINEKDSVILSQASE